MRRSKPLLILHCLTVQPTLTRHRHPFPTSYAFRRWTRTPTSRPRKTSLSWDNGGPGADAHHAPSCPPQLHKPLLPAQLARLVLWPALRLSWKQATPLLLRRQQSLLPWRRSSLLAIREGRRNPSLRRMSQPLQPLKLRRLSQLAEGHGAAQVMGPRKTRWTTEQERQPAEPRNAGGQSRGIAMRFHWTSQATLLLREGLKERMASMLSQSTGKV